MSVQLNRKHRVTTISSIIMIANIMIKNKDFFTNILSIIKI